MFDRSFKVISCRNCPFTGSSDGEAVVCCHPERPYQPKFGAVEDSDADGTPPPHECPLREEGVCTTVELADGI
jgi:hypothetical protein